MSCQKAKNILLYYWLLWCQCDKNWHIYRVYMYNIKHNVMCPWPQASDLNTESYNWMSKQICNVYIFFHKLVPDLCFLFFWMFYYYIQEKILVVTWAWALVFLFEWEMCCSGTGTKTGTANRTLSNKPILARTLLSLKIYFFFFLHQNDKNSPSIVKAYTIYFNIFTHRGVLSELQSCPSQSTTRLQITSGTNNLSKQRSRILVCVILLVCWRSMNPPY